MLMHTGWATDEHGFIRCAVEAGDGGAPATVAIVEGGNGLYMVSVARAGALLARHRMTVVAYSDFESQYKGSTALEIVQDAALKIAARLLGVGGERKAC